jgi:hypothetical protein
MKRISKLFLLFLMVPGTGALASPVPATGLSPVVPAGDGTYAQLSRLEKAGLLPTGTSRSTLTRLEVAGLVFQARENLKEIVLAQADNIPPPPPSDSPASAPSEPAAETAPAPPPAAVPATAPPVEAASPAAPLPTATPSYVSSIKSESQEDLIQAEASLQRLEGA